MFVSHTKNVCQSQNSMKPFFLYYQLIIYVFLFVSAAVPVIIDNPSKFQDFLCVFRPPLIPLTYLTSNLGQICILDQTNASFKKMLQLNT